MTRVSFHFKHEGEIITSDVIVTTAEEWASDPQSKTGDWCVIRLADGQVVACQLLLPAPFDVAGIRS